MAKEQKTKGTWILLFLVLGIIIGVCAGFYGGFFYLSSEITFELNGESYVSLELGQAYSEEGCKAIIYGEECSSEVSIKGTWDSKTPGTYLVTYTLKKKPTDQTLIRSIVVKDSSVKNPTYYLVGRKNSYLHQGDTYQELGTSMSDVTVSYFDSYGLPIKELDTSSVGVYFIKYSAAIDEQYTSLTRRLEVINSESELPVLKDEVSLELIGNTSEKVLFGKTYVDTGYVALINGQRVNKIKVTLNGKEGFDTKDLNVGSYTILYQFTHEEEIITLSRQIIIIKEEISNLDIHFMPLENGYTGDCIYIKAGDNDILIDAGSRQNSAPSIKQFLSNYVTDDKLEYVITTHADQDHIAGMVGTEENGSYNGIMYSYQIGTIVDFANTNKGTGKLVQKYFTARDYAVSEGAKRYSASEVIHGQNGAQKVLSLADNITLTFLDQKFYDETSSDENNYSVCFLLEQDTYKYLFTGDLEKEGEASLVEKNQLPKVDFFKAGHHGSYTASNLVLLNVIQPKLCVVDCVAGSVEYTQNLNNTFPSQDFINRISQFTDQVYCPSYATIANQDGKYKDQAHQEMNGEIILKVEDGAIKVNCSNNTTILKETEWFKQYRVWNE